MDSAGLRAILDLYRCLNERKSSLQLIEGEDGNVPRVLRHAGLESLIGTMRRRGLSRRHQFFLTLRALQRPQDDVERADVTPLEGHAVEGPPQRAQEGRRILLVRAEAAPQHEQSLIRSHNASTSTAGARSGFRRGSPALARKIS